MAHFPVHKQLNLPKTAERVLDFWKRDETFQKSIETRPQEKPFIFFEGPPSANGMPGIHHVMARSIKDIFCRYKTQQGYRVERKAGWDTHGLPIELGVEKELGITKEDIGTKISVEDYNAACRKAVMRYTGVWSDLTDKMGYWVDMEDPYVTYKSKYMESVWWLLKNIYSKDLLYKGYTIQPYSPAAGTGLSSHELNQPGTYQDVTDTTVVAQFKALKNTLPQQIQDIDGDVYFLAWTTTPWTLPSNTALTVGPKIEYSVVRTYNQYTKEPVVVILASALMGKQFTGKFIAVEDVADMHLNHDKDKIPYQTLMTLSGEELIESRYEQLMPYSLPYKDAGDAFRVIGGDFVTTEDGTGIVHTAPTFGADDAMVAKQAVPPVPPLLVLDENDIPQPLVDLQGRFRESAVGPHSGKPVKNQYDPSLTEKDRSVDVDIAIELKTGNKAWHVEKYVHSYPHCWRTHKPVLYYPLDSWFIKATEFKDRMYELNQTINWKPESTGTGRFGNWLAGANDWNLSRSRYWGIPLPIWRTEDGSEELIIGSIAELKEHMTQAVEAGVMEEELYKEFVVGDMSEENYDLVDLHKNIVDQIKLVSPSGATMTREPDLIDVWFDSGSMPYAQWHYPFENKQKVEDHWRKADFIAEGVDQTRGWFYTLHAIATMTFDDVAYKNVVSNGLVLDKHGRKMSKSAGNAVEPFGCMEEFGTDAIRWYMVSNANPWDNLKFNEEGIKEVQRKFFGTLYNTYGFMALYANLDNYRYDASLASDVSDRPELDRWILSALQTLIKTVTQAYEEYEPTLAARAISDFVQDNLSNWHVRLSRRRFWKGDMDDNKRMAYDTLYTCLESVARLMAPIAPFYSDELYRDLNGSEDSVHLSSFPVADESLINTDLEHKMSLAQNITSLVLSLRQKEKLKVRQPLQKIMLPVSSETERENILAIADIVKAETNIKEIELIDADSGVLTKEIKPNFKTLGPKYGKIMKQIASAVAQFGDSEIAQIESSGSIDLKVADQPVTLDRDDVIILAKDIEGWSVASDKGLTVALDIAISDSLREEGIARELVNRIQNLRKDSGFEVQDEIQITLQETPEIQAAVSNFGEYIKAEVLATQLELQSEVPAGTELEFDGISTRLQLVKQ